MTNDVKLLKQTLRYIREEVDELIKREARLKRENSELKRMLDKAFDAGFELERDD